MKNVTLLLLVLCLGMWNPSWGQDRSIKFEQGTFAEALAKAKETKKLLFIDCYTSWCGPCKMLARDVFTNNEVADYFNATFVSMQVDCEKGEGPEIKKRFGVSGYPTLLFLDGDGNLVNKFVGASDAKTFLEKVKTGLDPKNSLYGKIKRYESGERGYDFMLDLIQTCKNARDWERARDLSKELLKTTDESKWLTKEMWEVISYYYVSPYKLGYWDYILAHADDYRKLVGDEAVAKKIGEALHPFLFGYACAGSKAKDKTVFSEVEDIIKKYNPAMRETLESFIALGKSASFEDFDSYFKTVLKVVPKMDLGEHYRFYYNVIGYLKKNMDDKQKKQFLALMQSSYDKSNEYVQEAYKSLFDQLLK